MYCPYCGTNITDDSNFCKNCGNRIGLQINPSQQQYDPSGSEKTLTANNKNWVVSLLLSYFFGFLGIDRFYLGYIGLGILKLITCGGCGLWSLIDFILIGINSMRDSAGMPLVGRKGNEWIFYVLIALSIVSFFSYLYLSFLNIFGDI